MLVPKSTGKKPISAGKWQVSLDKTETRKMPRSKPREHAGMMK